ncbi:MAG: hypothetical protein Q8L85_03600 [Alphaproteobacteria bacterium]|nr:hypothetical protein [Alphaproteobacteria bacterium]
MKKLSLIAFAVFVNISSLYADREEEITQRLNQLYNEIFEEGSINEGCDLVIEKYKEFLQNIKEAEVAGYTNAVFLGNKLKTDMLDYIRTLFSIMLEAVRPESEDFFQKATVLSERLLSHIESGNFKQIPILYGEKHRLFYIDDIDDVDDSGLLPENFNPVVYLSLYPDLQNAYGGILSDEDRMDKVTEHYINHGKNEGRAYLDPLPEDFNPVIYLSLYPDLQNYADQHFTSDEEKKNWAAKHYLMHGKKEGRRYL